MTEFPFLLKLKQIFLDARWQLVAPALREDAWIWHQLIANDLGMRALGELDPEPENWSPASLALLDMHSPELLADLRADPDEDTPAPLRRMADRALEDWLAHPGEPLLNLGQAGLLALALRQRSKAEPWSDIFEAAELSLCLTRPPAGPVLACLFGLVPNPLPVALELTSAQHTWKQRLVLAYHAALCNPLPEKAHSDFFYGLMQGLTPRKLADALELLHVRRPPLAEELAKLLLQHSPAVEGPPIDRTAELASTAAIYRVAGTPEKAVPLLADAIKSARRLQADLASELALAAHDSGAYDAAQEAWKQASQFDPNDVHAAVGMARALLAEGRVEEARYLLADGECQPVNLLALAETHIARGDHDQATTAALQAMSIREKGRIEDDETGGSKLYEPLSHGEMLRLAQILLGLNRPVEAAELAQAALPFSPADIRTLKILAQAYFASGEFLKAAEAAQAALALQPFSEGLRYLLIDSLEAAGCWVFALQEYETMQQEPDTETSEKSVEQLCAWSHCALHAGNPARALEVTTKALAASPEHGRAHYLLGKALLEQGDTTNAREYFQKATLLIPEHPHSWLALAETMQAEGDQQEAMETLQAAVQAAPDHALVQLVLGETYLERGAPTQALACLRRASALAENMPEHGHGSLTRESKRRIPLHLGMTLLELGHKEQAREALEQAHHSAPDEPGLAWAYAQALLSLGDLSPAREPLSVVVEAFPGEYKVVIDYTQVLLEAADSTPVHASQAINLMEGLLASQSLPEDVQRKARSYLAEALAASGDYQRAVMTFRSALEDPLPGWQARLSAGLGRAALELGDTEIAVAALKEAVQANPEKVEYLRSLAEAYLGNNLPDDALEVSKKVIDLSPNDVESLTWYAGLALQVAEGHGSRAVQDEALQALKRAAKIAPRSGGLLLRLGNLLVKVGEREAALETFERFVGEDGIVATAEETFEAALRLKALDASAKAMTLFEKVVREQRSRQVHSEAAHALLTEALRELAKARRADGDLPKALEALDEAVEISPGDAGLRIERGDLLEEMGKTEEAAHALEEAWNNEEGSNNWPASLHYKTALLLRRIGLLDKAMRHAEDAANLDPSQTESRFLAADLARAILHPRKALAILQGTNPAPDSTILPDYFWLQAELAFESGDDESAETALAAALEIVPDHPRSLANRARVAARSGNADLAQQLLEEAMLAIQDVPSFDIAANRSLGAAALEMGMWEIAITCFRRIVQSAGEEALSHLNLAQALTLRAEAQRMCRALSVQRHDPGKDALSDDAREEFERAVARAIELTTISDSDTPVRKHHVNGDKFPISGAVLQGSIARWDARGKAAFQPKASTAHLLQELPGGPDTCAMLVRTLGEIGDIDGARIAAQSYPLHPWVLLQLALAMRIERPRQAYGIAQTAVESLSHRAYERPHETPLRHYLLAMLAHKAGDPCTAWESVEAAFRYWADEPRWLALAGEVSISLNGETTPEAVSYLERAAELEPDHAPHYRTLGQALLESGAPERAVEALEEAVRLQPTWGEAWCSLARAQQAMGNLEDAAVSAEKAVGLNTNSIVPLLLRGEIALDAGDFETAQNKAHTALELDPIHPRALHLMGRILLSMDKPEEAISFLEQAASVSDNPLPLWIARAKALYESKGALVALDAWLNLAERYPSDAEVLAALSEAQMEAGQSEASLESAEQALHAEGEIPLHVQARLHYLLGRCARRQGQLDRAVHHLSIGVQSAPDNLEGFLELGHAHQDRREFSQAYQVYKRAMSICGKDHRPYYYAGVALKENKDYLEAEAMLRQAVELSPGDVTLHRALGAVVALNLVHNPAAQRPG